MSIDMGGDVSRALAARLGAANNKNTNTNTNTDSSSKATSNNNVSRSSDGNINANEAGERQQAVDARAAALGGSAASAELAEEEATEGTWN
jgi:hypothetical protein